jgi:hypothetical protein
VGDRRSALRPGKDGEYAVVLKVTGDYARQSDTEEAAGCCRWQGGGGGLSLMGEVVPRCGIGSLVKIVVRESVSRGVMGVQVGTLSQRRVRESSLFPSTRFCEDPLQLKRVTSCCCPVLGATEGLDVTMVKLKRIVGP